MKKDIIICTSNFNGGVGRVLSLLTKNLILRGFNVKIVLTVKQHNQGVVSVPDVPVFNLYEYKDKPENLINKIIMLFARAISKLNGNKGSILKFYSRNYQRIKAYKQYLKKNKDAVIISFLNEPIFLTLLSAKRHKVIISERNDPAMFVASKTNMAFIHNLYPKAYRMVCQSPSAEEWYNSNCKVKTSVIFNPVKSDLPVHKDIGSKVIVNFCRISKQKHLLLLVDAFQKLHEEYHDYKLEIIGNAAGEEAEAYLSQIKHIIEERNLSDSISVLKGIPDVYDKVKDYAMFVSSSDFEGMSNSMLEAMAMGMPVVCTDCPAGGARAVINDHDNGLLTPVGDADALYKAMKEILDNPELAEKLGRNALKIRETQSVENIVNQWIEILER